MPEISRGDLARAAALACLCPLLALALTDIAKESIEGVAPLRVPLRYGGDGLYSLAWVKSVGETGSWSHNPRLAAPFGQRQLDFPNPGLAQVPVQIIKAITLLTPDPFLVVNAYFLLTFSLVAASAYGFFRCLGLRPSLAMAGAVIYDFLPYHTFRGTGHLITMNYFAVPIALTIALWLVLGDPHNPRARRLPRAVRWVALTAILGLTSIYYAFFNCFFLVVAGVAGWLHGKRAAFFVSVGLCVSVVAMLCLAAAPTMLHVYRSGANAVIVDSRAPAHAEILGLKLAQLVLPRDDHRIGALAALKEKYNAGPLNNENRIATVGVLAAPGVIFLLFWPLCTPFIDMATWDSKLTLKLHTLSLLFVSGFLLSTTGGFGSLFALLASPAIRAYNRISVYLALLTLGSVLLLVQKAGERRHIRRRVWPWLALALVTVGLLDQVPDRTSSNRAESLHEAYHRAPEADERFFRDAEFVRRIEGASGRPRTVFQLPYVPFPEGRGPSSYDPLRPYLHSAIFRWSAGAMKGRPTADWLRKVAALPPGQLLPVLVASGFDAMLIERAGYRDRGAGLREAVGNIGGVQPVNNEDWIYVDLDPALEKVGDAVPATARSLIAEFSALLPDK